MKLPEVHRFVCLSSLDTMAALKTERYSNQEGLSPTVSIEVVAILLVLRATASRSLRVASKVGRKKVILSLQFKYYGESAAL